MQDNKQFIGDLYRAENEFSKVSGKRAYSFYRIVLDHIQLKYEAQIAIKRLLHEVYTITPEWESPVLQTPDEIVRRIVSLRKIAESLEKLTYESQRKYLAENIFNKSLERQMARVLFETIKHDDDPTWEWCLENAPASLEDYFHQADALRKSFYVSSFEE